MKLPGRGKLLLFSLMLFAPGFLLVLLSKGKQEFIGLKSLYEVQNQSPVFYDLDSNLINPFEGDHEITIITTIQNSCFDNTSKECAIYPYYIEELFYNQYKKAPHKYKKVKIFSIITDFEGKPVHASDLLKEEFLAKFNDEFWQLIEGDPKQLYSHEKNGQEFTELLDSLNRPEFLQMALLIDGNKKVKAIRPIIGESFAREFNEKYRFLVKEKDIKAYNEKR